MNRGLLIRLTACLVALSATVYSYVQKQNELTQLSLETPILMKDLKELKEQNVRLQYQIKTFETPTHLMELAKDSRFTHLRYPANYDVLSLTEGVALKLDEQTPQNTHKSFYPNSLVVVGSAH